MQFQANIPFKLTHKFINALGYTPKNQKVLIIRDFFTAILLAANNSVTFVTDDVEARDLFENKVINNPIYGSDDSLIFVDTEDNKNAWKEFIEEVKNMPKFDVAIMNPPYDKNLHLKILEQVIHHAEKVVNISPIDWLLNCYGGNVLKQFNTLRFTSIERIGFLRDIFNDLDRSTYTGGIYYIDTTKTDNHEAKYYITKFITVDNKNIIDEKFLNIFIAKIKSHESNLAEHIKTGAVDSSTKFTIIMPKLVGNPGEKVDRLYYRNSRWDKIFYQGVYNGLTPADVKKKLSNVTNYSNFDYLEFKTKAEAENWINSVETKFIRFCQLLQSIDSNRRCKYTPYMKDYTQPWDDKRFCNYFGITGYIDDNTAVPGSEWEEILNAIK